MSKKLRAGEFRWRDEEEKARIEAEAEAAGYSLGNYVRIKLGLDPLQHGGSRQRLQASLCKRCKERRAPGDSQYCAIHRARERELERKANARRRAGKSAKRTNKP
jgi:hypothetical protein